MREIKRNVKKSLDTLTKSNKTLKDIYDVMFSHSDSIAYEQFTDYEIAAITYQELDLKIKVFAAYLKNTYPNAAEEYVGIDLANSPNFFIAFWGVLMSGNKPYLVNSFYPCELRIKLLKKLKVKLVITDAADYTDFTVVNIAVDDKKSPSITNEFWQNEFALSSALTGLEAKICVFDGEAVVNQILNAKDILKNNDWLMSAYKKRVKVILILPLFHVFGIMVSYFWIAFFGYTMVFLKDNSPETIRGTINRFKVTHIFAPPIVFHKLYKDIVNGVSRESEKRKKKFSQGITRAFTLQNIFPSLGVWVSRKLFKDVLAASFGTSPQFMISGGAPIDADALRTINCIGYPLFNGYGTTETSITSVNLAKKISRRVNGSIGEPFKSVNYTYDEDGTLSVSGNSICKRIITLEGEENGFACIKTNDLVKTINGQHFIVGRKSDLYIGENGENISPDIIENELKVKKAQRFCVLEIHGKLSVVLEYGEKLPAAIINNEVETIKNSLANISYGQYIKDIFVTRQSISDPNAIKISRALLRQNIDKGEVILMDYKKLEGGNKEQDDEADDATMLLIKQVFGRMADTDAKIASNTDFFLDLGGTSLDYIAMISEFESIFNIRINFEEAPKLHTPENFHTYIMGML